VQGSHWTGCAALHHQVAGAALAASALGGHAQFELDFSEAHASVCMAGNLTAGNPAANTDDHGGRQRGWLLTEWLKEWLTL
jgi:hypothetical protein